MAASSSSAVCVHCDSGGPIVFDPDTSTHVCTSCGIQHSSDPFENQMFSSDGVRHYSLLPTTGDPLYQELKTYRAKTLISTLTSRLGLSVSRSDDVLSLVSHLTSSSFAVSESFLSILTAASAYVVARRNSIPISLPEAADAAGCEERQITRILSRILRFIGDEDDGGGESSSHLPHFDTASALSRTFKTLPVFSSSRLDSSKIEQMVSTGQFLIHCAGKWFLSTGRRPMPLVAAVAAFVSEINGVEVPLEEIATGIHAVVSTSRLRLRELKEALVSVAKNLLPWGQDVDSKNLTQNAPLLIRLMQVKASRSESGDKTAALTEGFFEFDLDGTFNMYSGSEEVGCNYFKVKAVGEEGLEGMSWDELKTIKFSEVSFSDAYKSVLERIDRLRESGGLKSNGERTKKKRRDEGLEADAWMGSCAGSWDSDKNLTLKEILERDVGYDALPPSFVNGIESRARRKEKIIAAKVRINQTMNPRVKSDYRPILEEEECLLKPVGPRKRKRRKGKGVGLDGIDWEDCIIELLLLHQVDEEEIEQETAIDEAELEPHEFAEKMQNQQKLQEVVNSYPMVSGFTTKGTGSDDFLQAMAVAVDAVLQEPVLKISVTMTFEDIKCNKGLSNAMGLPLTRGLGRVGLLGSSLRGVNVSFNIGPVHVVSSEQVQAIYNATRRDERTKYSAHYMSCSFM